MKICDTQDCTGCFACINRCPVSCISVTQNGIGHVYVKVDEERCINCVICRKICPANGYEALNKPMDTYAAWSLDENEHKSSSSGGLATLLSRKTIAQGGVVYGCSSVCTDQVKHIRIDCLDDIPKLQGSKYVQSYTNDTYGNVKNDLKDGLKVLFIGTPCQIAGIYSFLGGDDDNLLTIDLICHGVPPQKLMFEHIKNKTEINQEKTLSFREKNGFYLKIIHENNVIYHKSSLFDLYYIGFSKGLFFRDSCYQCQYANKNRTGDITLGDFWGLGKQIPFKHDIKSGVSVVLVNTAKGKAAFEGCKKDLFFEERTLDEAVAGNYNLRSPSAKHPNTEKFVNMYSIHGFDKSARECLKKDIIKYKILGLLQKSNLAMKIVGRIKG